MSFDSNYVILTTHTCGLFPMWDLTILHLHVYTQEPPLHMSPSPHCYTLPRTEALLTI
jgi:hypothetical protein